MVRRVVVAVAVAVGSTVWGCTGLEEEAGRGHVGMVVVVGPGGACGRVGKLAEQGRSAMVVDSTTLLVSTLSAIDGAV